MKKSKSLCKLLVLSLTVALIASNLPSVFISTNAESINVFTGDDFTDAAKTDAQLVSSNSKKVSDSIVTENGETYLKADATTTENQLGMLNINDSYWPTGNLATKMEFDYQLGNLANGSINIGDHNVYLAYDQDRGCGFGIRIKAESGSDGNIYFMIRNFVSGTGVTASLSDNAGKFVSAANADAANTANTAHEDWAHIVAEIDYSDFAASNKITVNHTVTVTKVTYVNSVRTLGEKVSFTKKIVYTLPALAEGSYNFKPMINCAASFNMKNLKVESFAQQANKFNSDNSAILAKTAETITIDDLSAFEVTSKAYDALAAGIKSFLTATAQKISALDAAFAEIIPGFQRDSFSDTWKTSKYWSGNPTITAVTDTNSVTKNGITIAGETGAATTLNTKYWENGKRPAFMSLTFKGKGFIYPIYDAANKLGCGLYVEGGTNFKISTAASDGTYSNAGDASGNALVGSYVSSGSNKDLRKLGYNSNSYWTTLDMAFDYSALATNGKISITYILSAYNATNKATYRINPITYTYTVTGMSDFRIFVPSNSNTSFTIADIICYSESDLAPTVAGSMVKKSNGALAYTVQNKDIDSLFTHFGYKQAHANDDSSNTYYVENAPICTKSAYGVVMLPANMVTGDLTESTANALVLSNTAAYTGNYYASLNGTQTGDWQGTKISARAFEKFTSITGKEITAYSTNKASDDTTESVSFTRSLNMTRRLTVKNDLLNSGNTITDNDEMVINSQSAENVMSSSIVSLDKIIAYLTANCGIN